MLLASWLLTGGSQIVLAVALQPRRTKEWENDHIKEE